jgi:L-asparaginase II
MAATDEECNPAARAGAAIFGAMSSTELRVETTRAGQLESVHRISCAVVTVEDRLLASSGDPEYRTWWRSGAKPLQAIPLVEDGAADRFGLGSEELALACASHSSEPCHLEVIDSFLAKIGVKESDLACGPHTPLSPSMAHLAARGTLSPTARWSNCSGKHAGMLALASHHGWPLEGYQRPDHPVQRRILEAVTRWTGMAASDIGIGVDGCTAVCFALPIRRMALAFARLGLSSEPAPKRLFAAMTAHPILVAGTARLCTDLMTAWPGHVIVKVGAEGIYCAAVPALRIGIALKVEDGDMTSAPLALLEVLHQALTRLDPVLAAELPMAQLGRHRALPIRNTRSELTGERRATGTLRFYDT